MIRGKNTFLIVASPENISGFPFYRFMPPDDPLGRSGPTLDNFLQKEPTQPEPLPPPCPYGSKKCTYGNKCKYYHPERKNIPQKSVTEKLAEQAKQRMQEMRERKSAEGNLIMPALFL